MSAHARFRLKADAAAQAWLDSHRPYEPWVIAYDIHACCHGGRVCTVSVRRLSQADDPDAYARGVLNDDIVFLIDRRAAMRLPPRLDLTLRGWGPFKHLDLDLDGEQWGELLYGDA